jgi:hypothetical protein
MDVGDLGLVREYVKGLVKVLATCGRTIAWLCVGTIVAQIDAVLKFSRCFPLETLQSAYIALQLIPTNKVLWRQR